MTEGETRPAANDAFRPKAARVLLVDDEAKLRDSLAEGLRLEGWSVDVAATGVEALHRLADEQYDLLVLDWMLPDLDGIEVLRRVRGKAPGLPVLMITARTARSDRIVAFERGATDFMPKPFAFADLRARCAMLLAPRSSPEAALIHGQFVLDLQASVLRTATAEIALTKTEAALAAVMLRHAPSLVTTEMLAREAVNDPAQAPFLLPVIERQMIRLAEKVRIAAGVPLFQPVRGLGYVLAGAAVASA